jgi:hypothetical protein
MVDVKFPLCASKYHTMCWISNHSEASTNPTAYLQQIDRSHNVILVVEKRNLHRLPYSFHCRKVDNAVNLVLKQTTNVRLQNMVCFLTNASHTSAETICTVVPEGTYTGCPRRIGPNFGRVFLRSNYTDITQNTYILSSMVMEILAREKCGLLWCLRTVLCP